jgi:hypothetical protein
MRVRLADRGMDCGGPVVLSAACEGWLLVSLPPGSGETRLEVGGMRKNICF